MGSRLHLLEESPPETFYKEQRPSPLKGPSPQGPSDSAGIIVQGVGGGWGQAPHPHCEVRVECSAQTDPSPG